MATNRKDKMLTSALRYAALLLTLITLGCATAAPPSDSRIQDTLPTNRPTFSFNVNFDDYTIGPVARGWIKISSPGVREAISGSYYNLTFPDRLVSNLGEGQLVGVASETTRFVLNSTLGIVGFFDLASKAGLEKHEEDIGLMLKSWGLPPGQYVMVPIAGPYCVRDLAGGVTDLVLNPLTWTPILTLPLSAVYAINGRAQEEPKIVAAKEMAVGFYEAVKDAYVQKRVEKPDESLYQDQTGPGQPDPSGAVPEPER